MSILESVITGHPFTRNMEPRFLGLLNECATYQEFGVDQEIFHEGERAEQFHLIHRGMVALQTFVPGSGTKTLQTIGSGEALGWSWLFPPFQWHFTAVAMEPVQAVSLCARSLRERIQEDREFGYEIAIRVGELVLERLQATRLRLLELYGVSE